MKIAVMGYGTVGRSLVQLLDQRRDMKVSYILELPEKCVEGRMTSDLDRILGDTEVDLVVDAMPAVHPSYEFMKKALEAGKHVVTSNKAALCFGFQELTGLAEEKGVALKYEASCGGTIPCIAEAAELSETNEITACYGIMNGTSNFILDSMIRLGQNFTQALKEAQALGYAEADPTADLSGYDVKNKLVILSNTAYHGAVTPDFPYIGIERVSDLILEKLAEKGDTVKLLGFSLRKGNKYALGVAPVIMPMNSLEANVPQNFNLFTLRCSNAGDVKIYGQGAGGIPTADAMLRDILAVQKSPESAKGYFCNQLEYAPELLTGTGYMGGEPETGTFEELVKKAGEKGGFFAFIPDFR